MEISSNAGDEKFYEEVARELQEKPMVPGLWTKAFAEMGGDEAKARALYIRYRVQQLRESPVERKQEQIASAPVKKSSIRWLSFWAIFFGIFTFLSIIGVIASLFEKPIDWTGIYVGLFWTLIFGLIAYKFWQRQKKVRLIVKAL